ncbi:MAG: CopG family ribbon-helix-helix protein [Candidatus Bipolaricaulia bacterium]
MAQRATLTIYVPQSKQQANLLSRLRKLAKAQDRSVNYLAVQAILDYLEQEEANNGKHS